MPTISASGAPYNPVPTETPNVQQPSRYQDIQARPEAFGAAPAAALTRLGEQFGQTGNILEQNALQRQELSNLVAADDASNQWQNSTNKILYGDPALGDTGFYGKHGRDAVAAFPVVRDQIDQHLEATRATLQNPRQQLQFDNETRRMRSILMNEVGRHYDQQFQVYAVDTNKASVDSGLRRMATASATDNDAEFKQATGETMVKAMQGVKLRGGGQEMIDDALSKVRSEAVKMRTLDLADKKPLLAPKFLEANTDALAPGEYHTLFREMRARVDKAQTQEDIGKAIRGGTGNLSVGGGIRSAITSATLSTDVDPKLALTTAQIESKMGNELGTRGNIFQLGKNEWDSVGGGQMGEPETDVKNGVAFLADKQREMSLALGRPPEPWETYLAHQQGSGGAIALLANPDKPAGQVGKPEYIRANGGDPNAPASEFTKKIADLYQKTADKVAPEGAPDTVVGEPKVSHSLPALEPGMASDSTVPGLKGAIERLDKIVPKDEPERFWRGVQEIRKQYNVEYQAQEQQRRMQKQAHDDEQKKVDDSYMTRLDPKNTDQPTVGEVWSDTRLDPDRKRTIVGTIERQGKADPAAVHDAANKHDLFEAMTRDYGTPGKLTTEKELDQAYNEQKITWTSYRELVAKFRDLQTVDGEKIGRSEKELMSQVAPAIWGPNLIDKEMRERDSDIAMRENRPSADQRMARYRSDLYRKIEEYKAANKNPADLFDQAKPDYFGKPETVKGYMPTMKQKTKPTPHVSLQKQPAEMTDDELKAYGRNAGVSGDNLAYDAAEVEAIRRGLWKKPTIEGGAPIR